MLNWNLFSFPPLFWVFTIGLVLVALAFVLPPLLRSKSASHVRARREVNIEVYRDQMRELEHEHAEGNIGDDEFAAAKKELEARLAEDALTQEEQPVIAKGGRKLGVAMGVAIPLLAFGIYFLIGNPWAIEEAANSGLGAGHGDLAEMLEKAQKKAQASPNDGKAWLLLAKTHAVMDQWQEADQAYGKAVQLLPKDASVLAGYAESQAILNGRVLKGRPMELVHQALEINPEEPKALELAGVNAFQEQNYAQAAHYFKQLLKQLPPDSPFAVDIAMALREAKGRAEVEFGSSLDKVFGSDQLAGMTINGHVELSPKLKDKVTANATIFLFAKPLEGGMPVAAVRAAARDLPLEFELNDTMSMSPDSKLSSLKEVTLTARISTSGEATAQSGDLEGVITPVKVGAKNIKLVIDTIRP